MNIFAIEKTGNDIDWHKSALSHDNYRVNKMIIESCQMLSTNVQLFGYDSRYRMSFQNHPSTIWARESFANFSNLLNLAFSLRGEFCRRHDKQQHGCDDVLIQMNELSRDIDFVKQFPTDEPTQLPLCMPDEYKCADTVTAYRTYFANKPNLRYFQGDDPDWVWQYRTHEKPIQIIDR